MNNEKSPSGAKEVVVRTDADCLLDLGEARRFIELLTGDAATSMTWQTFDDSDVKDGRKSRILQGALFDVASELAKLNDHGAGIFVMVNKGDGEGREAKSVTDIRALFVDHDRPDANPLASIEAFGLDPDFLVESSAGKFHAYRLVDGMPLDASLFRGAQEALASKVGSDTTVKDLNRVLRVPGFVHRKVRKGVASPAFVTRIHEVRHEGRVTSWREVLVEFGWSEARLRLGNPAAKQTKTKPRVTGGDVVSRASGDPFTLQVADGEGRNAHVATLAGICAARGLGLESSIDRVRGWNEQNIEPIDDTTLVDICTRIHEKESAKRAVAPAPVYSELSFAQWFANDNAERFRYVSDLSKWMVWSDGGWTFDEAAVMNAAKAQARSIMTLATKELDDAKRDALRRWNASMEKARSLKSSLSLAQSEPQFAASACDLDCDSMLLAVDNGVIDLRTGGWRSARPEDLMTKRAHVPFDRVATCPRWLQFIEEVTQGDADLGGYLQRMAGYCLTGSTREQALLLLVGSGANGKSVFTKAVQSILGSYAVRLPASALAARRNDSVPADIAMLAGARVALASELNAGMQLDEARVKDLVSDDTITARHFYGSFFSFAPSHKLIVASNHLPIVAGTDHGIWRRIRVARFEARFDERKRDPMLLDKLMAESSGILNWMIEGCIEWQRHGLATPRSINEWTAEYRQSLDVVGQFIEQCCITAAADPENARFYKVGAAVLVDAYEQFSRANGMPHLSGRALGHEFKQRGFKARKSNGTMIYEGLAVYKPWVSNGLREKIGDAPERLRKAGVWEPVVDAFAVDSSLK